MQIDWWTLAIQTVNFLVVVWLLGRFLYRPVRRIIDEREAADRAAMDEARSKAEAAEAARKDYEARRAALAETERTREAEHGRAMEQERAALLEAARAEAVEIVAEAREKAARAEAGAVDALRDRIAGLAADLAARALAGGGGIDAVTDHLDALPEAERAALARDLAGDEELSVVAPGAMPEADRATWRAVLRERLGRHVAIAFREDPSLIGGVALHFPHGRLDFSVAGRLDRALREMKG
jgi:F-type H+-transporting ATPase subunit b